MAWRSICFTTSVSHWKGNSYPSTGMSTAISSLLEIPEVREQLSPVTLEEYHAMPERNANGKETELIRGIVIEQMSKSPPHSWFVMFLFKFFLNRIPAGYTVWSEQPLTLEESNSEPEPDIAIVKGDDADYRVAHATTAELVIEVAATKPSVAIAKAKLSIYADAGIKECWIVDAQKRLVEVYKDPNRGTYTTVVRVAVDRAIATLKPASFPDIVLPVKELFPS